jgi:peptide/nickel transport system permease protein
VDTVLMRVTDALESIPIFPVLIVVAAIDLNKVPLLNNLVGAQNESMYKLFFILLLFSWMGTARLVRGSVLAIREREFILASKTLGAKDSTIILKNILPNVISPLLVSVTLGVGASILFESVLSFLGLGIQPPTPSWGNMLSNGQELIWEAPSLAFLPGLLILITTMSFNYLGDGLQDAIDPKAIRR